MGPDIQAWLERLPERLAALASWSLAYEAGVLVLTAIATWLLQRFVKQPLRARSDRYGRDELRHVALRAVQRLMWPVTALAGVLLGRGVLRALGEPTGLLDITIPLLLSLATIRLLVYVLRKGFRATPLLKAWENIIVTGIWTMVALHLVGWLPAVETTLDELAVTIGSSRVSVLSAIKLTGLIALLLTMAFWISGVIERRMRASPHMTPSLQVAFGKFSKFFLIALAIFLAIDAVGIDLTTLTVFGGALGVGIGFGLQRITSNFISGFILVLDRSIKPGDVISVGTNDAKYGWVQELRARYVVVRDRDGVERLIPNENLITSEVVNWSYSDPNTRVRIPVQISYDDDPEHALALLMEAAKASPRILAIPEPAARLLAFADNGIELELRVWINDPENGIGNVRTAVNLAIWRLFKANGITIPYPQRDVHLKTPPARPDTLNG
ncbi:mechanosensitive ion channel family protein [Denitromonas iodatirespirans]|uniref:Mechanosensitive ion channel n=1 Tax=Denitromonas iodatirespirans TaxID=2795389 RepID=A0A944D6V1_DENI1|nr:mechanosensitive ion channel domain-containing protein [Denitromonas iodatirespirans]MBT0959577.1 mechanosensitive ion channel [Denitromonas iodatirespirans]